MATLAQIQKSLNDWITAQGKRKTEQVFTGVRNRTPVDTGRARDGWEITAEIAAAGDVARIENAVPYIGWLEFGSPTVEAAAMVRTTLQEVSKE
jgi:hypothetical protein